MNGLNPNYNTTRPNSGLNLRNCCRNVKARESLLDQLRDAILVLPFPKEGTRPPREWLKLQQIWFYLLIIQLWWYSVLISFAHNVHYKMLWVSSSRPLELHFLRACLLSARCSSSGGSTWRLQSACKLLKTSRRPQNQTAAMNCHTYITPLTMGWRSVSCLWRLRLPTSVGLLCQFECRVHQAHRCVFPHFRPPVTLSTVSWFCCRSRCRPVISWCRVSLLPLELRHPSAWTQSP